MSTSTHDLPLTWHALPEALRKPFWTIKETCDATGFSRSSIDRFRDDPNSSFPRGRVASPGVGASRNKGRVLLPALSVLAWMEGRG